MEKDSNAVKELKNWEPQIKEFDARLLPIAKRTVDLTDSNWLHGLRERPSPLDEADVRIGVEALLAELITAYAVGNEQLQAAIRRMFSEYLSFAWAATLREPKDTFYGLRQHLILFSMQDQGKDSRDALLTLQDLCSEAANANVDLAPLLREIAAMSSSIDKYGMGSTREMLLKQCNKDRK